MMTSILACLVAAQAAVSAEVTDIALLRRAVDAALATLDFNPAGRSVQLAADGRSEADGLVRDALTAYLGTRGCAVYYGREKGELEVQYRVGDLGVYYQRRLRSFVFGPARIERAARAAIDVTVLDAGRVVLNQAAAAVITDTIPERLLSRVRSRTFTREETLVDVRTVWEPVLVLAVAAALVLIFYVPRIP